MDELVEEGPSYLIQLCGLIALMRPKQWIKNSFVLAPLLFSISSLTIEAMVQALLATYLFCLASSAAYILNDIYVGHFHSKKIQGRPLATEGISLTTALGLLVCLYGLLILGWFLTPKIGLIIVSYLLLDVAYSCILKHRPVLDIFTIAISFSLRVYAGAVALNTPLSSWMFVTTFCLTLYLAAIKRRQELCQKGTHSKEVEKYSLLLINHYAEMAGAGTLFFYGMLVMSANPQLIITVPFVLFGLFRYWYVAEVLECGSSPTNALLADWPLFFTVVIWVVICAMSL